MSKLVSIAELSAITGLSVKTIRRRVHDGTMPFIRANASTIYGKLLFNVHLVQQCLLNEAVESMRSSVGFTESKESLITFDDLEEQPTTMANVDKLWGSVNHDDVDAGRFAPDTLALRPSDEPTSETISTSKAPKRP